MDSKISRSSQVSKSSIQYPKRDRVHDKREQSQQSDHSDQKSNAALKSYQNQTSKDHAHSLCAKDIASFDLHTLKQQSKCSDALKLMSDHHIHHLPIIGNDKKVQGIITDRDILSKSKFDIVDHHMNTKFLQIDENLKLGSIIKSFVEADVSVLILYSHSKLGLITHSDVIEALYRNRTLEIYV